MKNNFILPLLVVIVGGFITYNYFQDKPNLVYSLSGEFSTILFKRDEQRVIKQLSIKNTGDIPANQIVIIINDDVVDYDIKKYSALDSIKATKSKSKLELYYPSLPPDGELEIQLISQNKGISKNDIEIKYERGLAKEVFDQTNQLNQFSVASVFLLFVLIILSFKFIQQILIWDFEFDTGYTPIDSVLKKSKPFYISGGKWNSIRQKALKNYFLGDSTYNKITELICFKVLNDAKPEYLNDEEWVTLLKYAIENYTVYVSTYLNKEQLDTYAFDFILKIKKPSNLPDENWTKILEILSKHYFFCSTTKRYWDFNKELVNQIKAEKPELVSEDAYIKTQTYLRNFYFYSIIQYVTIYTNIDELKEKYELTVLGKNQQEGLSRILESIKKVIDKEEKLNKKEIELVQKESLLQNKVRILDYIIMGKFDENELKETDSNFERLRILYQEIKTILSDKKQAKEDALEYSKLKNKVLDQLETIDRILQDPSYINKIEEYDMKFSSGNFENLKRVAESLSSKLN